MSAGSLDVVLLHGGWHCSASWGPFVPALRARGHRVVAVDLPGHGWRARHPKGYFRAGQPGLETEPTTSGEITLDTAADVVIEALVRGSGRPAVLVSHSSSGAIAGRVAEARPDLVDHLVYVAGIVPSRLVSAIEVGALPEYGSPTMDGLVIGDPVALGTLRINPRATDPFYRELLRAKFYGDLSPDEASAYLDLLCPDQPLSFLAEPVVVTAEAWGSIPRTYVVTTNDKAIAPAVQEILMNDADDLTPGNPFRRHRIDSGHSPFASHPAELADIVSAVGG